MDNRAELILALRDEISSGMAKVNASLAQTRQAVEGLGASGKQSFDGQTAAAEAYSGSLLKQIGVYALVVGAAYKLEQGAVGAFKAGIQAVDAYKLTTIGVAATITDLAKDQTKGEENYSQALAYSKGMYNELELAAARYFASGKDMTEAWNILAQKGIVLKHEEIDALGIIVDRIKLSTQGQVAGLQIAQELRSMITGQARVTDQVGMLLKDRIPNLEAELQKHRQIGDVVTWLASQFKGLAFASTDIQGTLESQYSTLGTLLTQVGRGGLGGAYQDIAGRVLDINDYLTIHKDDLMVGIAKGWSTIAWAVEKAADAAERVNKATSIEMPKEPSQRSFGQQIGANFSDAFWGAPGALADKTSSGIAASWDFASRGVQGWMMVVQEAYTQADKLDAMHQNELKKTSDFLTNPEFWYWAIDVEGAKKDIAAVKGEIQGVIDLIARPFKFVINAVVTGLPSWFGGGSPAPGAMPERKLTTPDTSLAAARGQARLKALGKFQILTPDFGMLELPEWVLQPSSPAKTKSITGKGEKGASGKGEAAADNSLENFVSRMKQETARAAGEGVAALDTWYGKEAQTLDKLAAKGVEVTAGRAALDDAYYSKSGKLAEDFYGVMAKESGNAYIEIDNQAQQWLTKFQGIQDKEGNIIDVAGEVREVKERKYWEADVKNHAERLGLEKSFYDQAAGLAVDLTEQVGLRREALSREIEIQRYQLAVQLEHLTVAKKITGEERDRYLANQSLLDQQKRFNFEMENNKGLSGWAYNRVKSENQKNTWADAMEGLEGFVNDAWTQGAQGALGKVKVDVIELGKTFALSAALNLGKQGIHKLFTLGAESILGMAGGPNKPAGTASNPYYVVQVGGKAGAGEAAYQRSVTAAGKTGMTIPGMGGGSGRGAKGFSFTDQYFKNLEKGETKFDRVFTRDLNDWNKKLKVLTKTGDTYNDLQGEWAKDNREAFNTEYIGQYQADFTGMTTGITNAWGMAQGLMTAAGASGEAQRFSTMASYGIQAVSLLYNIVAKGTLAKAWSAGASAYSSTWEFLGFPWAVPVAPIMAAVAFAGTLMAGSGGGGGGGGGGGLDTSGLGPVTIGGKSYHSGGIVAHQGMIITAHNGLAPNEVIVKALRDEWILNPQAAASLRSLGGPDTFDNLNSGRLPVLNRRGGSPAAASAPPAAPAAPAPRPHLNLLIQLPSGEILREDDIWRMTQKGLNKGKIRISTR